MSKTKCPYKLYLKENELDNKIPKSTNTRAKKRKKLDINMQILETEESDAVVEESLFGGCLVSEIATGKQNDLPFSRDDCAVRQIESEQDFNSSISNADEFESGDNDGNLYSGSKISTSEGTALLLAFIARHRLTKEALDELLDLVNLFLPVTASIPRTFKSLKKKIAYDYSLTSFHFYCPNCNVYLGKETESVCSGCTSLMEKNNLMRSGSFFIVFDSKSVLENLFKNPEIAEKVSSQIRNRSSKSPNSDTIHDIMDGLCYKNLGLKNFDISCTFNTDGVPVFKSSKFSIWPILYSVNELPYQTRRANVLIAGLWFGVTKPNFDSFFKPFVLYCNELATQGIDWHNGENSINSRVLFPLLVVDSVARCLCQGLTQFNGAYGCTWCLTKGCIYKFGENGQKWIYPPSSKDADIRTSSSFLDSLKEYKVLLSQTDFVGSSYLGIKFASRLLLLKKFDIVNGFAFDYMHTAFLGVSRSFTNHWFDSKNNKEEFYCGTKIALIDKELLKYVVPFEYDRAIRSVSNIKFWKASEWRTWTYISVIVLKGILPDVYLVHYSKFVEGIMLLTAECIKISDIQRAKDLINEFVLGVENLYGLKYCSYNVHILKHAADCVINWGPLWAYSAFQFENYNGILLNRFNGTQHIELQIANSVTEMMCLQSCLPNFGSLPVKELFEKLMKHKKLHKNVHIIDKNVLLLGSSKMYSLNAVETKELVEMNIVSKSAQSYKTCIVRNVVYNTISKIGGKRCNCVFETDGKFFVIQKLMRVQTDSGDEGVCLASHVRTRRNKLVGSCFAVTGISNKYLVIRLASIGSKFICGITEDNTLSAIVKIPNCIESE